MVRLESMTAAEQKMTLSLPCAEFKTNPFLSGPPLKKRRVAIVTTSGLHCRNDRPFTISPHDFYRVIPGTVGGNDLVMSHGAASFDRSGFQRDLNVVFPIDRLRELEDEGVIGSLADVHYSISSSHQGKDFEEPCKEIAKLLKKDNVNAFILTPV
jgi:D-proline reductase (dithiol) PrdB